MFGVTRRPLVPADVNLGTHPAQAKHISVLLRDQVFSVQVLAHDGSRVPISTLKTQLEKVVADTLPSQPPICLLTSGHRDVWAKSYANLVDSHRVNRESMDDIETSLFAVSLDDYLIAPTWTAHAGIIYYSDLNHRKCLSRSTRTQSVV
jgi:carnitine O-acetyltransferase